MNRSKWRSDEHLARLYAEQRETRRSQAWFFEAFKWRRTRWVLCIGFVGGLSVGWVGVIVEAITDVFPAWIEASAVLLMMSSVLSALVTYPWDLTEMRRAHRREEARLAQEAWDEPEVDAETRS